MPKNNWANTAVRIGLKFAIVFLAMLFALAASVIFHFRSTDRIFGVVVLVPEMREKAQLFSDSKRRNRIAAVARGYARQEYGIPGGREILGHFWCHARKIPERRLEPPWTAGTAILAAVESELD